MNLFRVVFFRFRPASGNFHFDPIRTASYFSETTMAISICVSFKERKLMFCFIAFFEGWPTIMGVVVTVNGGKVCTSSIFNRGDSFFAFCYGVATFAYRFRCASKEEGRAVIFWGAMFFQKLIKGGTRVLWVGR